MKTLAKQNNGRVEALGEERFYINQTGVLCHLSITPNGPLKLVNTILILPDGKCVSDFGSTDYSVERLIQSTLDGFTEISETRHSEFTVLYLQAASNAKAFISRTRVKKETKAYLHRSMN